MFELIERNETADKEIINAFANGIFLSIAFCTVFIPASFMSGNFDKISNSMDSAFGVESLLIVVSLMMATLATSLIPKFIKRRNNKDSKLSVVLNGVREIIRDSYLALCGTIVTVTTFTWSVIIVLGLFIMARNKIVGGDGEMGKTILLCSLICTGIIIFAGLSARIYDKMQNSEDRVRGRIVVIVGLLALSFYIAWRIE